MKDNKVNQDSNGNNIPTNSDIAKSLRCIWNALNNYKVFYVPHSLDEWDDICTAFNMITEEIALLRLEGGVK